MPHSLLRVLYTGAALLCCAQALAADTQGSYSFRNYGAEQGLRNQAVTGLAQDQDGFILAGSEDGLFRYDGNRFQRFGSADGLLSDAINFMYTEPGGRVWLVHAKGAVAWADTPAKTAILPALRIDAIGASLSGYLLLATEKGFYEGPPGKLIPVQGLPQTDGAAWISPDGKEFLAAAEGKLYRRAGNAGWASRSLPKSAENELPNALLKDAQGRIWIRGRRMLLRLASFEGQAEDLSAKLPGASVQKSQIALDPNGKIWTPTNLGLARFDGDSAWLLGEQQGLPTQWATSILFDREGNPWIASEGVQRLQGRGAWTSHTRRQKLPSDTVWSVYRSRDGLLWAGTNRGLAQAGDKQWQTVDGTAARAMYAFAEDAAGNLWAGGNNDKGAGNTLLRRAAGGAGFQPIPFGDQDDPLSVNSMQAASDGALYVGTLAHGLHRVAAAGGGYASTRVALPGGDAKEQINQVIADARGRLWVAGMAGLAWFDGKTWRRFGLQHGLRELHVEALALDPAGDLLVSYWNMHGLTRFKLDASGLAGATQVDQPAALVNDNIYSMGFDARGALWLGTAQGVKRWHQERLDQYGRGEGLPGDDSAANAFWADRNGDVWVGMSNGLAHYHAADAPPAPPLPAARILRVHDGHGKLLAAPVPRVAWNDRALEFRFAVLSYINESKVRVQVRLVGFEDDWRDTDVREARYTGLPPGSYRFEVQAAVGAGQFGPSAMREVVILAPWWRTPWAIALGLLGTGALLLLFLRWRLGRLHRRNSELEVLVRARTDALEKANAALQDASMVDPLTGLKNRRFLGLSMPDELARVTRQYRSQDFAREGVNKTLLFFMIDLDHFKSVNDSYGHAVGDLVLQQSSLALRKACRDADYVVRWGGEEFLIVARNADRNFASTMAENLRKAVCEQHYDVGNGVTLQRTCSIGFSAFPVIESAPGAYPWEDAVKMADQCLYAAKRSGRNAWVGVLALPDAASAGAPLADDLGGVAASGAVQVLSSLPAGTPVAWN